MFQREDLARRNQMFAFTRRTKRFSCTDIPAGKTFKELQADLDPGKICLVFGGRHIHGSYHIAKVIKGKTRHDRVEIDNANSLIRVTIEKDITDLGIIVDRPEGQFATCAQILKQTSKLPVRKREVDLLLYLLKPVTGILLNGFLELPVPERRVVEMRNRLVKRRFRKTDKQALQ